MLKKFAMVTTLAAAVLSGISGNAVRAEVLVPLQEYLSKTIRHYETNQYKTSYTVYVPQLDMQGDRILLHSRSAGEPIKLPVTKRNGVEYVDIENNAPMLGVTYTESDGAVTLSPAQAEDTVNVLPKRSLTGPISWAFDPWPSEGVPYTEKLNTSGDNIISPSWFKLHTLGLELNPNIQIDYVNTYKSKGYHVWPLITNRFDPAFTSGILADEELWKKYAQSLVQYAYIYGFGGYNFDFENIDYADRDRLTRFVAYLSGELHKYNIQSSVDVTGYSSSPEWSLVYNRKSFADTVDYIVLMAYDETWARSTKAGPVASYPWVREHVEKMIAEIPSQKLVLGVPFYMRLWHDTNGRARSETLAMKNTKSYFEQYGSSMTWDDSLKLYYLAIPRDNGSTDRIWFEDNKSLALKLDLVKELKLAGFAAWRKGFEDESTLSMIRAADLGKGIPTPSAATEKPAVTPAPTVQEMPKQPSASNATELKADEKAKKKAEKEEARRRAKIEKERLKAEAKAAKERAKLGGLTVVKRS